MEKDVRNLGGIPAWRETIETRGCEKELRDIRVIYVNTDIFLLN